MSRRLEFGRRPVLKEGDDAHAAQRAIAGRLRGKGRRCKATLSVPEVPFAREQTSSEDCGDSGFDPARCAPTTSPPAA